MYCQNCGREYGINAKYCQNCGAPLMNTAVYSTAIHPEQQNTLQKELVVALILSITLGTFGADRFYLGYIGLGILKLLTCGGCGIWWLVDIILIATRKLPDSSGMPLK